MIKELLNADDNNHRSQAVYLAALREMSSRASQFAQEWTQQRHKVKPLQINVGSGLVEFFDTAQGGTMLEKIAVIRHQLATEQQFTLPAVYIRDDPWLKESEYELLIVGEQFFLRGSTRAR